MSLVSLFIRSFLRYSSNRCRIPLERHYREHISSLVLIQHADKIGRKNTTASIRLMWYLLRSIWNHWKQPTRWSKLSRKVLALPVQNLQAWSQPSFMYIVFRLYDFNFWKKIHFLTIGIKKLTLLCKLVVYFSKVPTKKLF